MATQSIDKIMELDRAISKYVHDGDSVAMGLALEHAIPFAAGHEIIRQGRKELTLIGPISDVLFDQMIGANTVEQIMAAWVGNVSTGQGYNFRRQVESGSVEMIDYSNYTLALALKAAADGLPCALTLSLPGSDIFRNNDRMKMTQCPFSGRKLVAVEALSPDVAIINAQRADAFGNAHLWGPLGIVLEAVGAAKRVILVCEELVSTEVIRSDPNRTVIPGFLVSAVVHAPWSAHPSGMSGYYNHDDAFYLEYAVETRNAVKADEWRRQWITEVGGLDGYLNQVGSDRLDKLKPSRRALAVEVDYGF